MIDLCDEELVRLDEMLDGTLMLRTSMKPSEWYESRMVMPPGDPFPGPIRYDRTPYWREVVDCTDPNHPARDITIMGPAQMGKSIMVLNPIVGYTIDMDPCNVLFLTGHSDLTREAMMKIEFMIQNCGLQDKIKSAVFKVKNNRTGDTLSKKEYPGGDLKSGSITNHNLLRQNTVKKSIADDLDAGQMAKDATGDTVEKIKTRTKAHDNTCKRLWVSTPQVKGASLIEKQLNKSDKRLWMVQCPKCGNHEKRIDLRMPFMVNEKDFAGLTWKLDPLGRVDFKSVGYICQLCSNFFTDKDKYEFLLSGLWIPTQEPEELYHYGYKIHGLYAPHGMTSWFSLACKDHACNPLGLPRKEKEYQTYLNDDLGELYEPPGTTIESKELQKNIRGYSIGDVPDTQSVADGNGHIVLLTLACDLGGRYIGDQIKSTYDDARLDWELVGHAENGTTYSLDHGSIGTFRNAWMGKSDEAREMWSYDITKDNNVWKELDNIILKSYRVGGYVGPPQIIGIDSGFAEHHVFNYIESRTGQFRVVGLKGDKESKPRIFGTNVRNWKFGASRPNLYVLEVGHLKDIVASQISLKWDRNGKQPAGFMNFPARANGKYELENFFLHYEAEHRVLDTKKGTFIWEKKGPTVQNHMFDCRIYNLALKEILQYHIFKEIGVDVKEGTWRDLSEWLLVQWGLTSGLQR